MICIEDIEKNIKLKSLEEKLLSLEIKCKDLHKEKYKYLDDYVKYDDCINQIDQLYYEIALIKQKISLIKGLIASNEAIDIYLDEKSSTKEEKNYLITIHNTLDKIGYVRVTLENVTSHLGNIGYRLDKKFQGKGYMLQALNLLKPIMIEEGLTKPKITVYPDNISSVKTIESFGGKLMPKENELFSWDTYEVNLTDAEEKKSK